MSDKESLYRAINTMYGATQKDQISYKTRRRIKQLSAKNPSFKTVIFDDDDERQLAIISQQSNNPRVKTVCALPYEPIYEGQIFTWNKSHWLISDIDVDSDLYMRGTAHHCNLLLRWQNEKAEIIERWCYSSVNTSDGKAIGSIINLTDGYYKLYLPLDDETRKLKINKRFLIDIDHTKPTAYELTNVDVVTSIFDEDEKYGIVIINVERSERADDRDNYELMIADYFEIDPDRKVGVKSAIEYGDSPNIKAGGYYKSFTPHFYDDAGEEVSATAVWNVTILDEYQDFFETKVEDNVLMVKAQDKRAIIGTQIKIELFNEQGEAYSELYSKVVNIL